MNDFRKDEFPKQVKLSVRSAGDAFLDDSLDANDVGYLNDVAQQVRPAAERATHLLQHVPDPRVGYDRIALRRSRNRNWIFHNIIPVLLTGTGICHCKSGSGRTGTGVF